MKQMKIKNLLGRIPKKEIFVESSHTTMFDDETNELEIVGFELNFEGELSEWIQEYLENPVGSRLHKNFVAIFKGWFEDE